LNESISIIRAANGENGSFPGCTKFKKRRGDDLVQCEFKIRVIFEVSVLVVIGDGEVKEGSDFSGIPGGNLFALGVDSGGDRGDGGRLRTFNTSGYSGSRN